MSHHHKILDYLESYHGGTGPTRGARTLGDGMSLMFPMRSGKPEFEHRFVAEEAYQADLMQFQWSQGF